MKRTMNSSSKTFLLVFCSLSLSFLQAQDFQRFAPSELPSVGEQSETLSYGKLPKVEASNTEEILPQLKGLVLYENTNNTPTVTQIPDDVGGVVIKSESALMATADFQNILQIYVGKPLSMKSLTELKREIILYYRKHDRPVMDVILPEQDISNGVVQLVVIDARFGEAKVTGNKYFSDATVSKHLTLNQGESISATRLLGDLDWINTNPFLTARSVFSPSEQAFSSDVILKVEDRFPWRFYAGYENSGNDLTGEDRYFAGFNWGNAFGLGHVFNYQITSSDDFDTLNAHSFSYLIPFHDKSKLDIYGGWINTESESSFFDTDGSSQELGFRYTKQLEPFQKINHDWNVGLTYKRTENALEFGTIPVSDDEVERLQLELGYGFDHRTDGSYLRVDTKLVGSLGNIFSNSDNDSFDQNRAGAENNYIYFKLNANWQKSLPYNLRYDAQLTGQWSAERLLSSEQLSVGGYQSVRGYNERELDQTDSGVILRNELHFPSVNYVVNDQINTETDFFVFSDLAFVTSQGGDEIIRQDGSTADTGQLWSIGVGLKSRIGENLTLRADYGFQLREAGSDDNGRLNIGATISF